LLDSLPSRDAEVVATLRADEEAGLELVVPVVRIALRARVLVALARFRFRGALVLDGNVDTAGHDDRV
jgi:hypothetical protein